MSLPVVIYRYSEPSKLDTACYLTLCRVGDANTIKFDKLQWYIQSSTDSEKPNWQLLGTMENPDILINIINLLK